MQPQDARALLRRLFDAAVAAAHPDRCLPPALPPAPERGRIIVLAAGKAAGSMAEALERHYLDQLRLAPERIGGIAVTRHGYGRPLRRIEMIEAGHPVPDAAGIAAAARTLALADAAGADDLVLVLMSGGASANWVAPAPGVSFENKRTLTRALLVSGATIGEINTVRKHLSRIKGGRLAARAAPARLVTLAISDVPGDDPSVIGSGPTVPDVTTLADARAVLARRNIVAPAAIAAALNDPGNESPKPGDPAFAGSEFTYEDLTGVPIDRFNYNWLREEPCPQNAKLKCNVIERYPIDKDSGYRKHVFWMDLEDFRVFRIDFYDRKNMHVKTLSATGFKKYKNKYWRPKQSTISNLRTGKNTVMRWENYDFDAKLTESDFSTRVLERIN